MVGGEFEGGEECEEIEGMREEENSGVDPLINPLMDPLLITDMPVAIYRL